MASVFLNLSDMKIQHVLSFQVTLQMLSYAHRPYSDRCTGIYQVTSLEGKQMDEKDKYVLMCCRSCIDLVIKSIQ